MNWRPKMANMKQMRFKCIMKTSRKVNGHTTAEVNRGIQEVNETVVARTKHSEAFFAAVGGAGFSTDIRAQVRVSGSAGQ